MKPKFLRFRNFKSVGQTPQAIELAPITLLFGPNSAGKSTVLQSLIYLREVLVHRNYDPDRTALGGDWLDLGGFRNLVHRRDIAQGIELSVGFEPNGESLPDFLSDHEREELEESGFALPETWLGAAGDIAVSLTIRWSEVLEQPYAEAIECHVDGRRLARIVSTPDGRQVFLERLDTSHPVFSGDIWSEESDAPESFGDRFAAALSPAVSIQSGISLEVLLSGGKPISKLKLTEIEALCDGAAKGQSQLLEPLLKEVERRASRQAAELGRRIKADLEAAGNIHPLGYLGVTNQTDALPDLRGGLKLAKSIWLEGAEDAEFNDSQFHLLSESLISGFIAGPLQILGAWLNQFAYIGPLRDLPPRNMLPQRTPDKSRWAKGLAAWEFLHQASDRQLAEVNYWLSSECLKTGYQAVVHRFRELPVDNPLLAYLDREIELEDQLMLKELIEKLPIRTRIALREDGTGLEVMPQDVGVGISQLFPVIALTITQSSGLIAIEQPELHVHPAIQVELADLFARYAIEHNKLMILETHSEHLILRLLRRIRETNEIGADTKVRGFTQDLLAVSYIESTPDGVKVHSLHVDDQGEFTDRWPKGFFAERMEELL